MGIVFGLQRFIHKKKTIKTTFDKKGYNNGIEQTKMKGGIRKISSGKTAHELAGV